MLFQVYPRFRRLTATRRINIPFSPAQSMSDITHLDSSTLLICVSDDSRNDLCDPSEPLFSLYSRMVEGGDNISAERHQKDAEGILLFVSPRSCLHTPRHVN